MKLTKTWASLAVLASATGASALIIPVTNASFESGAGALPTPVENPPMSGTIGGWTFTREAAIESGSTVPVMGIQAAPVATDGAQTAFIQFPEGMPGTAVIAQDLNESVHVSTMYTLVVDVITVAGTPLPSTLEVRLLGGAGVLVSSADTSHTQTVALNPSATRYVLKIQTGEVLEVLGQLRVELRTASTASTAAAVHFDNVVLDARSMDTDLCYANCDGSPVQPILNANDFQCFINNYAAAKSLPEAYQTVDIANCDQSIAPPVLNANDFQCFINEFAFGCP